MIRLKRFVIFIHKIIIFVGFSTLLSIILSTVSLALYNSKMRVYNSLKYSQQGSNAIQDTLTRLVLLLLFKGFGITLNKINKKLIIKITFIMVLYLISTILCDVFNDL